MLILVNKYFSFHDFGEIIIITILIIIITNKALKRISKKALKTISNNEILSAL